MLANEKISKPHPIGITGLNFSRRIADKYSIFRKSGRLPDLIYLRLCGIRVTKKVNIISLKSAHSFLKLYFNLCLKLLSSWNPNKTGSLQGAAQRGNLNLRPLYFPYNDREPHPLSFMRKQGLQGMLINTNAQQTQRSTRLNTNSPEYTPYNKIRFFTLPQSPGDTILNLPVTMDRLEVSSDQAQKRSPMINPGEIGLQLLPLSFMRKQGLQDMLINTNTQQTRRSSHLNTDSPEYASHNKMRFFTLPQSPGDTILNHPVATDRLEISSDQAQKRIPLINPGEISLQLQTKRSREIPKSQQFPVEIISTGKTILNLPVTIQGGEKSFFEMTLGPQKVNNHTSMRSNTNIIPGAAYPEPVNSIQKTSHVRQERLLSRLKGSISDTTVTPTNLILKKVIGQDADIFSNHNPISLIHKKTGMQNTDTALANQENLETEKTILRKIINENLITDTIKERPIQGINMIADRVYKIIEKRIAIERDRRGLL